MHLGKKIIGIYILLLICIQAFSQDATVNLKVEGMPIRKVLKKVESQSGYSFFYSNRVLDSSARISVDTHGDVQLSDFLEHILPSSVGFEFSGKVIVLKKLNVPRMSQTPLSEAKSQSPTDEAYLSIPALNLLLDETVVVGYGTLKKTQLVGAVETLGSGQLEGRSHVDVTRSLQGQMPGLNIIQSDGKPNHGGDIYVRGNSMKYQDRNGLYDATSGSYSMGLEGSALILVDGVESSLSRVNPADILSVSLLKDAASAVVYGARGAYGVILVTTKAPQKGSVRADYTASMSIKTRTVRWEDNLVSDSYTWASKYVEFFQGDQRVPDAAGSYPSNIATILPFSPAYYEEIAARPTDDCLTRSDGSWAYYGNTSWYGLIYKRHNLAHNHSVNIQGSGEGFDWMLSGRFYSQDSIYKIADETFSTINLRSKGSIQLREWLKFVNNTSLYKNSYRQPTLSNMGSMSGNLYAQLERYGTPLAIPFNPDGSYTLNAGLNGFEALNDNRTHQSEEGGSLCSINSLEANLFSGVLNLKADYAYQHNEDQKLRIAVPLMAYNAPDLPVEICTNGYKQKWQYDVDRHTVSAVATITPDAGPKHDVNIVLGGNIEKESRKVQYSSMLQFLDPDYPSFSLMPADQSNYPKIDENGSYDKALIGFFARANYTFLRRYILEFAGRQDASSLFPPKRKWGFFPSASLGWRVSEEPWMNSLRPWCDNLKLRANLGSLGNERVTPYSYIPTYSTHKSSVLINGSRFEYISIPNLVFEDLSWSTVTTWDLGLDADFLRGRLSLSGDLFLRDTKDLYIKGPTLPAVLGTATPKGNYGALQTRGWEVTLRWKDSYTLAGSPLELSLKTTLWDARSWVTRFNSQSQSFYDLYPGKEIGEIWGWKTDGYFLSNEEADSWVVDEFHKNGTNFRAYAGDLKFLDLNGNGSIDVGKGTLEDHGDMARIGNTTPRYHFGASLDLHWKGVGCSIFLQGVGRRDWYPSTESGFFWGMYNRPYGYLPKEHLSNGVQIDYSSANWTVVNADDHPYWTRPVGYSANRNVGPLTMANDYYLQNAAYLRVKNVTVHWDLPKTICSKIDLSAIRLWASADNLACFSPIYRHTNMFDPEVICSGDSDFYSTGGLYGVGEGYSYPMMRTLTLGLDLSF